MKLFRTALLAVALLSPPAIAAESAADFAARLPVEAQPGAGVQKLQLPAQALVASRSPGLADLRLFDAVGQALPIARLEVTEKPMQSTAELQALPILGRAGALRLTGVELTLDEQNGARVARIDGAVDPAQTMVLGNLLDTRQLQKPVASLRLDADLPLNQPVTMIVEASSNLRDWAPLARQVLYRASAGAAAEPIDLGHAQLKDRYLRLRWQADGPLVSPVVIRAGNVQMQEAAPEATLHRVGLDAPTLVNAHDVLLSVPFQTAVEAIDIRPARDGMLVPVRVFGRDNVEKPWTLLAAGTVFRLQQDGQLRQSVPLTLGAGPTALMRIEADRRTAGFETAPKIELLLKPQWIAFVASGRPPYQLAAGRASVPPAWLPVASMVPEGQSAEALPEAKVASGTVNVPATAEQGWPMRRLLLWGLLLLGTLVLGVMALTLRRRAG